MQRSHDCRGVITAKESWHREVLDAEECWQHGIAIGKGLISAKECWLRWNHISRRVLTTREFWLPARSPGCKGVMVLMDAEESWLQGIRGLPTAVESDCRFVLAAEDS
jgi:hypothetical protein